MDIEKVKNYYLGICGEDTCMNEGEHYVEFTINGILFFVPLCPKHFKLYSDYKPNENQ